MTVSRLISDAELADLFGVTLGKLTDLRVRYDWPCVKLGRFEVRFTEDQVAQILAAHTEAASPKAYGPEAEAAQAAAEEKSLKLVGPTKRSAGRRAVGRAGP